MQLSTLRLILGISALVFTTGVFLTRHVYQQQELYFAKILEKQRESILRQDLPLCPDHRAIPHEPVNVSSKAPSWSELEGRFTMLKPGGSYTPLDCQARETIAVIIPYRDREEHLKLFLQHMHPFFQRQYLAYTIYVVELEPDVMFQKTLLMNAGFKEVSNASKDTSCFVFHDVDMLPQHTGISYACATKDVRHPTVYVKQFGYKRFNSRYAGGCLIFPKKRFEEVNGFSNLYWGWGGEDVDMFKRLTSSEIHMVEDVTEEMRYMSWDHARQPLTLNKELFVNTAVERMFEDGLSSVRYRVLKREQRPLYTWLLVASDITDASYKNIKPVYVDNPY